MIAGLPAGAVPCDKGAMADKERQQRRKGAVALGELVGPVIDPVVARRGFATSGLIAAWPEIVGPAFADCTAPERIAWPRTRDEAAAPGVLVLRVEGPRAIYVQHELPQIVERINAFFGYAAIGQVRIVQAPVSERTAVAPPSPGLAPAAAAALDERLATIEDDRLRAALGRLGRGVLGAGRE